MVPLTPPGSKKKVELPSVPHSLALHIQSSNPHYFAPWALLNHVPDPAQDSRSQPPFLSSNPGPTAFSSSLLSPFPRDTPITRSGQSLPAPTLPPVSIFKKDLSCTIWYARLWMIRPELNSRAPEITLFLHNKTTPPQATHRNWAIQQFCAFFNFSLHQFECSQTSRTTSHPVSCYSTVNVVCVIDLCKGYMRKPHKPLKILIDTSSC